MTQKRKIIYEPHPVPQERKRELRAQGYKILDAHFAPAGYVHPDAGLDDAELQKAEAERLAAEKRAKEAAEAQEQANANADELDVMDVEQLHALAKERGVKVHANAGADKVREALRQAA